MAHFLCTFHSPRSLAPRALLLLGSKQNLLRDQDVARVVALALVGKAARVVFGPLPRKPAHKEGHALKGRLRPCRPRHTARRPGGGRRCGGGGPKRRLDAQKLWRAAPQHQQGRHVETSHQLGLRDRRTAHRRAPKRDALERLLACLAARPARALAREAEAAELVDGEALGAPADEGHLDAGSSLGCSRGVSGQAPAEEQRPLESSAVRGACSPRRC
mmetsp:Transcript_21362/g.60942  ORF Transcript_21362/g.60942 Transcript_21362/m.60942 type:complete len:217 (+) Transcript_21362:3-653(+)